MYAIQGMCGVVERLHAFLSLALNRGEWSASRPVSLTNEARAPRTHRIGVWMGPRTGLGVLEKKKIALNVSLHILRK